MNIKKEPASNRTIISGVKPFNLQYTLECGQAFRWRPYEDTDPDWNGIGRHSYVGVAGGRILRLWQEAGDVDNLVVEDVDGDMVDFVIRYFGLEKDHQRIESELKQMDPVLSKAVEFASGLRLASQDPWECLISFIISARNSIPLIQRAVENLCKTFGHEIQDGFFAFPEPRALASAPVDEIEKCGTGFRAPYVKLAAETVSSGALNFEALRELSSDEIRKALLSLKGVGPKIADCVLLFGLGRYEAFPVDIWIARIMSFFYFGGKQVPLEQIRGFAVRQFGRLAGYAQEYLYYYARTCLARDLRSFARDTSRRNSY